MLEDELFSNVKLNKEKLLSYGFKEKDDSLIYEEFLDTDLKAVLSYDGKIRGHIYDMSFGEEYTLFRAEIRTAFAESIKNKYENLLNDIITACGTKGLYKSPQAERLDSFIMEEFHPLREFPFQDYPSFGTYKNEKGKWFAIIMDVPTSKIKKDKEGNSVIVNLKIDFKEEFLNSKGIYPAYHMNKKYWITVILDDTVNDEMLYNLVKESYHNVLRKKP